MFVYWYGMFWKYVYHCICFVKSLFAFCLLWFQLMIWIFDTCCMNTFVISVFLMWVCSIDVIIWYCLISLSFLEWVGSCFLVLLCVRCYLYSFRVVTFVGVVFWSIVTCLHSMPKLFCFSRLKCIIVCGIVHLSMLCIYVLPCIVPW